MNCAFPGAVNICLICTPQSHMKLAASLQARGTPRNLDLQRLWIGKQTLQLQWLGQVLLFWHMSKVGRTRLIYRGCVAMGEAVRVTVGEQQYIGLAIKMPIPGSSLIPATWFDCFEASPLGLGSLNFSKGQPNTTRATQHPALTPKLPAVAKQQLHDWRQQKPLMGAKYYN